MTHFQTDLDRIEDLLSTSRAERDEIGIKYNALSERVSDSGLNGIEVIEGFTLYLHGKNHLISYSVL